jgi:hypothetical protein
MGAQNFTATGNLAVSFFLTTPDGIYPGSLVRWERTKEICVQVFVGAFCRHATHTLSAPDGNPPRDRKHRAGDPHCPPCASTGGGACLIAMRGGSHTTYSRQASEASCSAPTPAASTSDQKATNWT